MKKLYTIFVLCFLLIFNLTVSAQEKSSSKVFTYHAESENWVGNFTIETSEEGTTTIGYLKYKGEDIDSVGQVSSKYETVYGELSSKSLLAGVDSPYAPIGEKGTSSAKGISGRDSNSYSKVEVVEVTVKWDGKTESFILYKQS